MIGFAEKISQWVMSIPFILLLSAASKSGKYDRVYIFRSNDWEKDVCQIFVKSWK